jgi:DNA-binding XRE family transcriptional regulator
MNGLEIKKNRKKLGLTQLELAKLIGVSKNTVLNYEKGSVIPESKIAILDKILNDSDAKSNINSSNATQIHPEFIYVPLVSEFAQAGYLGGYGDVEYIETLPKIGFVINPQDRGNFLCFEVRGDSMDNDSRESLIEKDIVLGREIISDLWSSKLPSATYIVVHKTEGIIIKKLKSHDSKSGVIILESLNSFYEDLEINLKNIAQLFKTSTIIRRS